MANGDNADQDIRRALDVVQSMIDISADRLEGLRTQCCTSAELTQQEIRTLEGKLIKLYSRQLVTKTKLGVELLPGEMRQFPALQQWLRVVGLTQDSVHMVCSRVNSLETLMDKSEHDLGNLLRVNNVRREEELRRLCRALHNLRRYMDVLLQGDADNGDLNLYWDSWDRHLVRTGASPRSARNARSSVPCEESIPCSNISINYNTMEQASSVKSLPSTSPPSFFLKPSHASDIKFSVTPANKTDESHGDFMNDNLHNSQISPVKASYSNVDIDDKESVGNAQVPKSPQTPTVTRGMGHIIAHRFTKTFKMMATCDYCDKQILMGTGLKCKECKYKCHKDCESKVPPCCGLPQELFDEFKRTLQADGMGNVPRKRSHPHITPNIAIVQKRRTPSSTSQIHEWHAKYTNRYQGADSSSNTSSCNSSTPSSPALLPANTSQTTQAPVNQQFQFPETPTDKTVPPESQKLEGSVLSDSERTGTDSADSQRTTVRFDSQDSQISDEESTYGRWSRQNSLSIREWDIPYDELKIGEPIGTGRFGTVYRGNWHGDVAIKVLNMDDYLDDDKTLEAFKLDVATFRKTRHENLVLFMGACMKPPHLAIVTSLSKGMSLYTHIHLRKDKFSMNKMTIIAQQISQGMGYLHARRIVHKDLKSKNIFLENGKVVITDFGLFSVTKLCCRNRSGNGLSIPPGWLCYLAPEIVRRLRPQQNRDQEQLPFTDASDVYAFGTVWYELLCGEWPFKGQLPEAIIWQVGKGMKQTLANLQASRDVKDILMLCWAFKANNRPDFAKLLATLEKLPRKRLARSPSHPVHLSRSVESLF